jgi:hypothetical protein
MNLVDAEAEEVVDFFLRENALAAVLAAADIATAVLDHGGPLLRHGAGKFVFGSRFRRLNGIL